MAACHNAYDNVTISGSSQSVEEFVKQLKKEDVFAKHVKSAGCAFHSPLMGEAAEMFRASMEKVN